MFMFMRPTNVNSDSKAETQFLGPFARLLLLLALVTSGSMAHANKDLAKLAGLGSCSDCHADDRTPKKDTLNPIGLRYLGCQLDEACYERLTAAVRTLQQAPAGEPPMRKQAAPAQAPAYAPAAAAPTAAAPTVTPGAPQGSYQGRCRNVSLNSEKTNLYGLCANGQNQTVYTRLDDFANCQSDIAVDLDGYLVCNLRGGGKSKRQRFFEVTNSGWVKLTQIKMNKGAGGAWIDEGEIDLGKTFKFAIAASAPCMMQATYYYGSSGGFTMNTCVHHKALVEGAKVRFE